MKKIYILPILFFYMANLAYSQTKASAVVYARVHQVKSYENGTSGDCWESGPEEYNAYVRMFIYPNSAASGTSDCLECTNNGNCTYGMEKPIDFTGNYTFYRTPLGYIWTGLDAWEDDNTPCEYNSSFDDCRVRSSNNKSEVFFKKAPPNPASWETSPTFGSTARHTWSVETSWQYDGTEGTNDLVGTCTPQTLTGHKDSIDAWRLYLNAGNTYVFETTAGPDTYLTLFKSDGYTIAAFDDDSGAGTLSKIVYPATESGIYYIEVSQYSAFSPLRNSLSQNAALSFYAQPRPTPTISASDTLICPDKFIYLSTTNANRIQTQYQTTWTNWSNDGGPDSTNLTGESFFRAVNVGDCSSYSPPIRIYGIESPLIINQEDKEICSGTEVSLTFYAHPSWNQSPCTFQWQFSTVGANGPWNDIPGASNSNYSTGSLSATRWYRAVPVCPGGGCSDAGTDVVKITVKQLGITCPGNLTKVSSGNQCGANVYYWGPDPSYYGCNFSINRTSGLASGAFFPVGVTANTYQASDNGGNTVSCSFTVTVIDNVPPTVVCQDAPVYLNSSGTATISPATVFGSGSDNCSPVNPVSVTPNTFNCTNLGANPVTLTASDNSNNTATCTAIVTVQDNVAPTAICQDVTVALDAAGNGSTTAAAVNNNSSDACGSVSLALSPTSFSCANIGANAVILTVTDNNTNTATCSATVMVQDNAAPTANCQDVTISLDNVGNGSATATTVNNNSSDACGSVSLALSPTSFTCADVGANAVTLTVTDGNSNTATCTATVTVEDNVAPLALCQDVTVSLDAAGNGSATATAVNHGSSDACGIASLSLSTTSFTCANVGANSVTLTVTDVNSNTATCSATVTVQDNAAPTANCQDVTVSLDAAGNGSTTAAAVNNNSSDACGNVSLALSTTNFTCVNVGANSVTLTVTDAYSNTATCSATVMAEDNVAPVAICQDVTVSLDAAGNGSTTAAAVNNGSSDACAIDLLALSTTNFTCADVGANTVILTVTDNNSNTAACPATVTVQDNIAPTAICQDITVSLDAAGNGSTTATAVNNGSSDACGIASLALSLSGFTCADIGANSVILTVTDNNSNTATCSATVTVQDNVVPTASCQDVTVSLDAAGSGSTTAAAVNNNSSDACGIASLALSTTSFTCANVGTNAVTLTVTDNNSNTATCSATVTVQDNTAPMAICQDVTVSLDAAGNGSTTAAGVNNSSSDACGIALLALNTTSFSCADVGANTVTLTVTDNNANTATCSATVTVEDNVAPTALCQDVTVSLDAAGNGSTTAAAVDNSSNDACGIASLALSTTSFTCANVGANVVTLTITDLHANTATCSATVTVEDNVAPNAICQNATVQLDVEGNGSTTAAAVNNGSNDACGIDLLALSTTNFTCANVGANTVTLTVTDNNSNTATCSATVTVQDNTAPMAICQDVTVSLDAAGNGSTTAAGVNNSSSDACGIASLALNPTSFTCSDVGANTVTLTVTDNNSNTATCSASVTVQDNIAPTATCQDVTVSLDAAGNGSTTAAAVDNSSSDACGIASLALSPASFTCANVGTNAVTLTVTDVHANTATCSTTVTVQDNVAPTATCQDVTVSLDAAGDGSTSAAAVNNGSSDPCGVQTLLLSAATFTCVNVGENVVTLTVTDNNSNTSSCTATVTVQDNVAPLALCQSAEIFLDQTGNATLTGDAIDNSSSDACGIESLVANPASFGTGNVGQNAVTLTVTDDNSNTATCSTTVLVKKRPTTLANNGVYAIQYSDEVTLQATLVDDLTGTGIEGKTIGFTIGSQSTSAVTDGSGVATATLVISQAPSVLGTNYTVDVSFTGDETYLGDDDSDGFTINREDARAYFTGSQLVSTGGSNNSEATVFLAATIKDISAVPGDPDTDAFTGLVANAKVNFINRDNGLVINPTPLDVVPINNSVGTVTYDWTVDIGSAEAEEFRIGIEVLNYYTSNNPEEDEVINVYKPLSDFVIGGGHIILTEDSEGTYAGDAGKKCSFGFNIKFNPSGNGLKGRLRVLVRRTEADGILHTYQFKGNNMQSLAVDGNTGYALFTGKCNIQDVTNPGNPISMGGNKTLQIEMNDNSGSDDMISFALYENGGALLFSSKWDGTYTVQQAVDAGDLVVHAGGNNMARLSKDIAATPPKAQQDLQAEADYTSDLDIFPNPFAERATIRFALPEDCKVLLEVYNLQGQRIRILQSAELAAGVHELYWDGNSGASQALESGMYLVRLRAGDTVLTKKVSLMW